ncbi:MAG: hypothetical protein RL274_976 [Pseudomonadota bacterium]|jgi:hypothetical protein
MSIQQGILSIAILLALCTTVDAREFTSTVSESGAIVRLRPEFKIPDEPNQLFYVQRSPNSNTVIYTARLDAGGALDRHEPVEGFWRKFNMDGSKQPLNVIERMMAYGVRTGRDGANVTFTIAALPERKISVSLDGNKRPQALLQVGARTIRLAYVYLHVVEGGLMPDVPGLDIFGTDIANGKAVHEHLVQK